jgi:hypothetical protein
LSTIADGFFWYISIVWGTNARTPMSAYLDVHGGERWQSFFWPLGWWTYWPSWVMNLLAVTVMKAVNYQTLTPLLLSGY